MSAKSPLPAALEVRELLEGLLGRDVAADVGTAPADTRAPGGATVAAYVDDQLGLRAIVLMDLALTAHSGAAIALMPRTAADDVVANGLLTPVLYDNASEILNIMASLFNKEDAPHVRLYEAYPPRETLPNDIQTWLLAYVPRLDMQLEITGYGRGTLSVLVV
ncbi:hypothetical protein ICW40_10045 [Actinotalea ferrariae]|uniref:hypothetical protein n=1 Tax=Actinotalea ferrariae TaxID=1386098 RepID=UPI001C8BE367|nr:hypothetical protein [Actinotalea ferrariae]MBX9245146.1 hypothetical protein [Actinotalea ferrariae]